MPAMDVNAPLAAAGRLSPAAVHAPPLAEEAAAGAPGLAGREPPLPRAACSRWPPATTSNRAWWCAAKAMAVRHGPAAAARAAAADAARAGRCWCRAWTCTCRRAALLERLPLRARRPAGRPDGLVGQRRRRRRPACRRLRRLPAAGARPPALARRAACRPAGRRPAAEDPAPLRTQQTGCSSPATCSTCRRCGATTAWPKASA
jgi:hypothetical protein